jgi:thymidylate synthase (FAD)
MTDLQPHQNDAVDELRWQKFSVGTHGFVTLADGMGSDAAIAQAARVCYGAGTEQVHDDEGLIRYLMRHSHTTPFEMCEVKLLVKVPMDAWRQWIRTRTASVNEYSTRYSEAINDRAKTDPDAWRSQSQTNKQGSQGGVEEWPPNYDYNEAEKRLNISDPDGVEPLGYYYDGSVDVLTPGRYLTARECELHALGEQIYKQRLEFGVAREQARKDLPLATYTEAYWKIDLHNLLHFLKLRMDPHAQLEIRSYANIIGKEIVSKLFPATWKAFLDYKHNALTLTGPEIQLVRKLSYVATRRSQPVSAPYPLHVFKLAQPTNWQLKKHCRERDECIAKLFAMGLINFEKWSET